MRISKAYVALSLILLMQISFAQGKAAVELVTEARKAVDQALADYPQDAAKQEQADADLLEKYFTVNSAIRDAQGELKKKKADAKYADSDIQAALDSQLQYLDLELKKLKSELQTSKFKGRKSALASPYQPVPGAAATNPSTTGSFASVVNTPWTRITAGVDISGASATDPEAKFFGEVFATAPLGSPCGFPRLFSGHCEIDLTSDRDKDPLDSRWWVWMNPRIGSVKQPGALSGFTSATQFLAPAFADNPNKIVQSFEFLGGVEYALWKPRSSFGFSGGDGTTARLGLSAIAGFGALTPLSTGAVTPTIFQVTSTIRTAFNVPAAQTNIVFVTPDRNRFFKQYEFGLRLKTYFFNARCEVNTEPDKDTEPCKLDGDKKKVIDYSKRETLADRFPGIIDLTYGQNEYVTGGSLHGHVFKMDGSYPFPFAPSIHLFGSMEMVFKKAQISDPFFLTPTLTPPSITDPSVFVFVNQPNRDRYKFGIGVDVLQLMRDFSKQKAEQQKVAAENQKLKTQNEEKQKTIETLQNLRRK